MTIKFTSVLGRLKYRYLLLVALLVAGLTFGTMFVLIEEEEEEERVICIEPIYDISEPSDRDKYPQSFIDDCPGSFQKLPPIIPIDFPKLEE